MKKLTLILSAFLLFLSLSNYAQNTKSKTNTQANAPTLASPSSGSQAKDSYIKNKEYMFGTSDVPSKNVYGDSLKGFDEAALKAKYLAKGLSGQEVVIYVNSLKRDYINKKYQLGPYSALNTVITGATTPGGSNNKPIGGGGNVVNVAPCINEDFESTTPGVYTTGNAVTGWSITSRINNDSQCSPTNWTSGSNEFEVVSTPITGYPGAGFIPNSPLGGTNVVRLNDYGNGSNNQSMTRITQTFPVTSANAVLQFAYAGYWEDGGNGHNCCPVNWDQPGLTVQMYACNGQTLGCSNMYISPGNSCGSTGNTFTVVPNVCSWTNWQVKVIDLTPYIGSCVTIEFVTTDCAFGGHYGSTLLDVKCGGPVLCNTCNLSNGNSVFMPGQAVSYCSGSNVAQISAPLGYATYSWSGPSTLPASQSTLATITITNPTLGSVWTVTMVTPTGCVFTTTNSLNTTTVSIAALQTNSSCAGGASGSATVHGHGAGAGYTATWTAASNNSVVATSTVANNLAPGVYSVALAGLGASCGTAVSTVTIGTKPLGVIPIPVTYCGNAAFLNTFGGSNFQWYGSNLAAIHPTNGGTNPSYTVTSPCGGCNYYLRYTSFQGCNDSLKYTLYQTQPGALNVLNVSPVCVGGTNGTATVALFPAAGAPAGMTTYSVWSTNPVYTATLSGTSAVTFTPSNMSAGSYSVYGFDGACEYTTSFNVTPFVWNYSLSVGSASTCPGGSVSANVVHQFGATQGQYTYSWSPTLNLFGSINTQSSVLIFPNCAGSTSASTIYTVVVTPTYVNCPIIKTMTVNTFCPKTPTINLIPNLCNNSALYTVSTTPANCTFTMAGSNNALSSAGVINPANANIGLSNFTAINTSYTCTATQTANFHVSQFVSSQLTTSTIIPLCVNSAPYNLNNIVVNSGGTWLKGPPPTGPASPTSVIGGGLLNPSGYNVSSNPVTGTYQLTYSTNSTPIPTVCPSFTTINVVITKTTTPVITPKPEFCTNSAPFSMTVNPTGGGWTSAVNGLINNSGLVTPSSATAAVPSAPVTYTVMDGPCLNTANTNLSVSKFVSAGLSGVVPNLCFNSAAFNLIGITSNTTGSWSYDVSLNPSHSPTTSAMVQSNYVSPIGVETGTYILTYSTNSFPNANLCPDAATIAVSVLNPVTPTISAVPAMCNNAAALQLTVTPNTGHWTNTSYLNNSGVFTPSLSQVGSNAVQYIMGTNSCNKQHTQYINIEAFVSAEVLSAVPDQCNNNPALNLTPLTVNNLGTWSGPGISGTNFDPATTGSGQFILTYQTASYPSGLCPDQSTVAVNVYSLATPVISQMGPFCKTALPQKLHVSPIGGVFAGAGISVVDNNGNFNPGSALVGNNIVTYSVSSGPCKAFAQTTINVEDFIPATFSQAGPYCKTAEPINMNSFATAQGGTWDGEGILAGTSMFHPSMTSAEIVTITHYTESKPLGLCKDVKTMTVNVRTLKNLNPVAEINNHCAPAEVIFNVAGTNIGTGTWSFGDESEPVKGLANVSHIYSNAGSFNATFNYMDDIGCKAEPIKMNALTVHAAPKADFTLPDEIFISDPKLVVTNQSTDLNNNHYDWKLNNEFFSNEVNAKLDFTRIGKFSLTLVATSLNKCVSEITKNIEVKNDFNVFIPNSFSPNFDGLNDVFLPVFTQFGLDSKNFEMEIFDRWGHSLYRTKDITKGWDGSAQNKGEPLKEDTYVYRIKYKDLDGNSYEKMGNIALLK